MRPTPDDGGGSGGAMVSISITEMQALVTAMEKARSELSSTSTATKNSMRRLQLSSAGMAPVDDAAGWVDRVLPDLRRRLAMARAIAASTPGIPNSVTFAESLISTKSVDQARADARRAAELMGLGAIELTPEKLAELLRLLEEGKTDPYFANELALKLGPRGVAEFIRMLTPYERPIGGVSPQQYDQLLNGLADSFSLATQGGGDLALPKSWQDTFIALMVDPTSLQLQNGGKVDYQQLERDRDNAPALWLLLARGHWSTPFLQQATTQLHDLDKTGYLWFPPGCRFIAVTPDGQRFMDPMVALMGALAQNPEAAHWAFTHGGSTSVPFPLDGEGKTGDVQSFLYDLLANHRFSDEEHGPSTVMVALQAAMVWKQDPSIVASAENLRKSMQQQQEVWDRKPWYEKWGHTILDLLGLVPVLGEVFDGANAAWYAAEGDWVNAGLSAAALIPLVGMGATALKGLKGAARLGDLLKMVDLNGLPIAADAKIAEHLAGAVKLADGRYRFLDPAALQKALMTKTPNMELQSETLRFVTGADGSVSKVLVYVDGAWVDTNMSPGSLKLAPRKAGDTAWDLIPMPRGEVIEAALAKSEYGDWVHIGAERGGKYPTIDFYKDGEAVSLKTLDAANAGAALKKNLDELAAMQKSGFTADGRPVTDVSMDLRVRYGQENSPAVKQVLQWAFERGVTVDVFFY